MKLLWALLLMWAFTIFLFSSAILASPFSTVSAISTPLFSSGKESISQVSATAMEAGSPGIPQVKIVHHHQDLNKKILIALILSFTLLGVVLFSLLCFWIYRLKNLKDSNDKRKQNSDADGGLSLSPIIEQFNSLRVGGKKSSVGVIEYQLLEGATNNFRESNLLGEGGRGRVYKACFSEKYIAAVKKINGQGQDAEKEFQNEMNWLTKIRHQNIISLIGYCVHDETRLLVYEMMQNGSLENQLYGPTRGSDLTWHLRIKIAVDIARGLEYLHEHCKPSLVHRDLKSSNVLLDSNFNAKLSDFGLAATAGTQNKNIKLSGTLGYVAPEYLLEGKLTDKSDVYAFGVVLLELLMGRRPIEKMSPTQCQSVVTWAMPQLTDRSKLPSIVDPVIKDAMNLKHLYQIAAVAVLCIQPEPSYRPLITDVLHSLIPLVPSDLGGTLRLA